LAKKAASAAGSSSVEVERRSSAPASASASSLQPRRCQRFDDLNALSQTRQLKGHASHTHAHTPILLSQQL
jgi:hypothetical protein